MFLEPILEGLDSSMEIVAALDHSPFALPFSFPIGLGMVDNMMQEEGMKIPEPHKASEQNKSAQNFLDLKNEYLLEVDPFAL